MDSCIEVVKLLNLFLVEGMVIKCGKEMVDARIAEVTIVEGRKVEVLLTEVRKVLTYIRLVMMKLAFEKQKHWLSYCFGSVNGFNSFLWLI